MKKLTTKSKKIATFKIVQVNFVQIKISGSMNDF